MEGLNKEVIYISYDGMTDPLGQSQVLPYLTGLSALGYRFHLISFEKQEKFEKFSQTIEQLCKKAEIKWYPQMYTKKPPVLSTMYDVYCMSKVAKKLAKENKVELVHCRSYIAALVGLQMKKSMGVKFIFDMRGFWADERVEGNIWNLNVPLYKWVYNFFKKKEIQYFSKADHTISLTYNGKEEIHRWTNIQNNPIPIQVIPCCVDINKFSNPSGSADTAKIIKWKAEGKFILGYVGSIGTWYMLDEMLDFFKVLQTKKETVFVFITQEQKLVHDTCKKKGIDDSNVYTTSCLHHEVPDYVNTFDASVFFIKPSFSKKASSPTKQGEIMAMGKPIICNAGVGDTDLVINKYHAGEVIESFNEKEYNQAIDNFMATQYDSAEIKRGALEFYSLSEGVKRYAEVYQKLIGN